MKRLTAILLALILLCLTASSLADASGVYTEVETLLADESRLGADFITKASDSEFTHTTVIFSIAEGYIGITGIKDASSNLTLWTCRDYTRFITAATDVLEHFADYRAKDGGFTVMIITSDDDEGGLLVIEDVDTATQVWQVFVNNT